MRTIRHNPPEARDTGSDGDSQSNDNLGGSLDIVKGLARIQDEAYGTTIPDIKLFVSADRAPTSGVLTLPYINEIINRVAKDMIDLGFDDSKSFSKTSIPTVDNALRTKKVQKALFDAKVAEIKKANPSLTDREAKAKADDFVANPDGPPTPHMSGRAIDFNLLVPGTQEMTIGLGTDNRIKMWNSYKWKVFNYLLQDRYKVLSLVNEPWHYEFGKMSEDNLNTIKSMEAQGKSLVPPMIPEYFKDKTKIDVEEARIYNAKSKEAKAFPYPLDFDIGSSDFAFYVANLQKKLKLPLSGKFDSRTATKLNTFIASNGIPKLKTIVDDTLENDFDLPSLLAKTTIAALTLGGVYYLFKKK